MDEDDTDAALAHQQELEARRAEEETLIQRCRIRQDELRESIRLFDEYTKAFWDNLRLYEQERYDGNYGKRQRR